MSFEATRWAWGLDVGTGKKMILLALANYADEEGSCFPGQEKLARMTGQTERTVRRLLTELEDEGLIRRAHRYAAGSSGRTSDRYALQLPDIVSANAEGLPDIVAGNGGGLPDIHDRLPDIDDRFTGHDVRVTYKRIHKEESLESARARARRLPEGWEPTAEDRDWAQGKRIPSSVQSEQLERFRDYWAAAPGRAGTKLDWSATWRNWLRREMERRPLRPVPAGRKYPEW